MVGKTFFNDHLDDLKECVNFASDEIMQIYNSDNFDQEKKLDGSPLTKADKRSNEIRYKALKELSFKAIYNLSLIHISEPTRR